VIFIKDMSFLTEEDKEKLKKFALFVIKELGIKSAPTISVQNGRGKLKTTANYDYTKENKIVKVNAHKRALVDVMRSLAHELTHHKQYENGQLDVKPPDIGGPIEDEANAKAGQFIKMYSKIDPTIYNID
jgi:Zn-dependent peptidase ImmA (M78 family)